MLGQLKNSVAILLIMSITAPGIGVAQEATDCDPATDPECAAPGAPPEAAEETSEEQLPAEDVAIDAGDAETTEGSVAEEATGDAEAQALQDGDASSPEEEAAEASDAEASNAGEEERAAEAADAQESGEPPEGVTPGRDGETAAGAEPVAGDGEATAEANPETADTEPGEMAGADTADGMNTPEEALDIEEPETVLSEDTGLTEEAAAAEAAAAEELAVETPVAAAAATDETGETDNEAEVEVATVTEETTRSSEEEFSTSQGDENGLSTFEKLLIAGAGAVVVGELLDNNRVVQNTGDRVVVQRADGSLYVLRDDDVLLRRPGYEVETRTFSDGSTVNEITKSDGSVVRTIRDPRGRVLRRSRILSSGREILLFDDTAEVAPVVVDELPLRRSSSLDYADEDAALEEALSMGSIADLGRRFSLGQIRNIRAVRELVPVIDLEAVTFDTGSAAIRASEARKLDRLGTAMRSVIEDRPWEVFLIEGHTDAVGSAIANLTLSDRRAESLALALTEYYDIPSENLVVQGYGERYLKVPVARDERANRRVTVRRITPLLGMDGAAVDSASGSGISANTEAADGASASAGARATGGSEVSQDAIDSCIDGLRAIDGARGGMVLRTEFSQANSLVLLQDAGGATWRCIVSNDGTDPFLEGIEDPAMADDGEGAMDGAAAGAGLPAVGSPTDVTEFQGARAGPAEGGLQALGYEAIRSDGLVTFWFNRETGACARITTSDGRYSEVVMLPAEDC